jgi:LacI family transcriptional regulator
MIRLKDIAARAGVSVMTVSKVLRDAPDISTLTKTKIRSLAHEMGYMPDSLAQGLRTRNTHLFGLVISSLANPAYLRVAMAIEERSAALGFDLILAHSLNDPVREEQAIRRLLSRRVEGLFIAPVYRFGATTVYEETRRRGTPIVVVGQNPSFCLWAPNVTGDDLAGSYAVTRHLVELGHRKIIFLAGPPAAPAAQERLEGYRRGLREVAIDLDDRLVFNSGTTIEDGEKAALQILQETPNATAIQAFNDSVAIGAANILLNQRIKVPEEISIAGFGNSPLGEYYRVPLTTVRQPKYRLGMAAMDTMQNLLRGLPMESQRLPTELLTRASTARAPNQVLPLNLAKKP